MALQHPTNGNYYKIVDVNIAQNLITFNIYENVSHRTSGITDFHNAVVLNLRVADLKLKFSVNPDVLKTIMNNIITVSYNTVKQLTEYSNFLNV